jgi:hypothetical protein
MRETMRETCLPFLPDRSTLLKPRPQPRRLSSELPTSPSTPPFACMRFLDSPALQLVRMVSSARLSRQAGTAGRKSRLLSFSEVNLVNARAESIAHYRRARVLRRRKGHLATPNAPHYTARYSEEFSDGKADLLFLRRSALVRVFLLAHGLARSKTSAMLANLPASQRNRLALSILDLRLQLVVDLCARFFPINPRSQIPR